MMLGAFCWAVSDEKYEFWILQRMWFYYTLAILNIVIFLFGISVGFYLYMYGAGFYSFLGMQLAAFVFFSTFFLVVAICTTFYYIEVKFYNKPVTLDENKPA